MRASAPAQSIAAGIALLGKVRDAKNAVSGSFCRAALPSPVKPHKRASRCQKDNDRLAKLLIFIAVHEILTSLSKPLDNEPGVLAEADADGTLDTVFMPSHRVTDTRRSIRKITTVFVTN